jgi:peptidyl-prolyl cis-trans isomerase C
VYGIIKKRVIDVTKESSIDYREGEMTRWKTDKCRSYFILRFFICTVLIIPILLLSAGASCARDDTVLARMDSETVTVAELRHEFSKMTPQQKESLRGNKDGLKSLLDRVLINKLLLAEARESRIADDKQYQEKLEEAKKQLLVEVLLKKKIDQKNSWIGDDELRRYYDRYRDKYKKDLEIDTSHILVKTEDEARQILARFSRGEDFASLARKYSIDPNAKTTGGNLGFHSRGTLLPEYEAAAFRLSKNGQISGIVKSQLGYHIIRLEAVRPGVTLPFEKVRDALRQEITQEKEKGLVEQYINDLPKRSRITIDETALNEVRGTIY